LTRFTTAMKARAAGIVLLALTATADACGETVVFYAVKDNTLIENSSGDYSNGAGEGIFCGRLGSNGQGLKLRLVVAFDISSIPPGSTITAASLRLFLEQGNGGFQTHNAHRLLANWGEGTSNAFGGNGAPSTPNDATWIHRYYPNQFWTTAGGQYVSTSSASASVGENSVPVTWAGAGMVNDVQMWVNNPTSNFGWMVRGNEVNLATAKKFISRNWATNPDRPQLIVTYTLPPCTVDVTNDHHVNAQDLLAVINSWGTCPAPPSSCPSDVSPGLGGDGIVNVADLLAVINGWGPCQ
jgi:hypothetical protein